MFDIKAETKLDNGFDIRGDRAAKRVYFTKDLSRFKLIKGNRPVNQEQVHKLAECMEVYGVMCSPIIVNSNGEIYDGQHRYSAAKKVGKGIYYIIVNGYSFEQIQSLNLTQRNWSTLDFHKSFVAMGKEEYIKLDNFWKKHPDFTLSCIISLCANVIGTDITTSTKGSSGSSGSFKKGRFVCRDLKLANDWAYKLEILSHYTNAFNSNGFVRVMIYMFRHPNFDFNRFLRNAKKSRTRIEKQATYAKYKEHIEYIYNYGYSKKVNLRFLP